MSNALKNFFEQRGMTQEELASKLGVSQAYISSLLSGNKPFGKKQAHRFEEMFGLSETWLLTGKGSMLASEEYNNNQKDYIAPAKTEEATKATSTEELIALLKKRDEQIDRLITLLEKKYGNK